MPRSSQRAKTKKAIKKKRTVSQGMLSQKNYSKKKQAQLIQMLTEQLAANRLSNAQIAEAAKGTNDAVQNGEISMNQQLLMSSMSTEIVD